VNIDKLLQRVRYSGYFFVSPAVFKNPDIIYHTGEWGPPPIAGRQAPGRQAMKNYSWYQNNIFHLPDHKKTIVEKKLYLKFIGNCYFFSGTE
jgi:hypothetical protein